MPYLLDKDEDGDIVLKCSNVPEGQLYPEEVSGQVVTQLLTHAEQALSASINKAVISVSCMPH